MSELEEQFHKAMIQVYENAKRYCKYNATYFLRMVSEKGGLVTAKQLIMSENPSDGFAKLWECGRLDLTVEAVALKPIYASLFTEEELACARDRLQKHEYKFE